jgi:hypothetical protein
VPRAVGESNQSIAGNQEEEVLRENAERLVVICEAQQELVVVHAEQVRLEVVESHVDAFASAGIVGQLEEATIILL